MSKNEKKCWSESYREYGSTIRVAERTPGGVLYLLWLDNRGLQRKRSLGHRDRKRARAQAKAFVVRLEEGAVQGAASKPLTFVEGISRAFDPIQGMYPTETKHAKEARRPMDRAAAILGESLTWSELTPGKIQYLVRVLARSSVDGRGPRTAEYMCDMLYITANWLRQEELMPETAALPKRNWKVRLKEEWWAITGRRVQPSRPGHSMEEVAKVFAALPHADPRLRLLIELSAELRSGQAVRGRRTDLTLEPLGDFGAGRFIVHGSGRKHGEVVDLHPELRSLVDEVLACGYLSEAEAAFRRGEIENYFLFPAGRLKRGKALIERCVSGHLWPIAIRGMFHELEEAAGVEPQPGRAFYGLRRQATDLAPEFAGDARVLNRLSGHADSATRERIYQDAENERVLAQAAKVRQQMRRYLRVVNGNGSHAAA